LREQAAEIDMQIRSVLRMASRFIDFIIADRELNCRVQNPQHFFCFAAARMPIRHQFFSAFSNESPEAKNTVAAAMSF
jgi:hypothetical protein